MKYSKQLEQIKTEFQRLKTSDPNFNEFGAGHHKYILNPPLSKNEVKVFEKRNEISLPLCYRSFITKLGDGGAGPFYGLMTLEEKQRAPQLLPEYLKSAPIIHPDLTDEEWQEIRGKLESYSRINRSKYLKELNRIYQGLLCIGDQGYSYYTMLVVSGEHKGRIVYITSALHKPMFHRADNFLDWYKCWLIRIEGHSHIFQPYTSISDENRYITIMENSNDNRYKFIVTRALLNLDKKELSDRTLSILKKNCRHKDVSIFSNSIEVLTLFKYEDAKEYLIENLHSEDFCERIFVMDTIYKYAMNRLPTLFTEIELMLSRESNQLVLRIYASILKRYSSTYTVKPQTENESAEAKRLADYAESRLAPNQTAPP